MSSPRITDVLPLDDYQLFIIYETGERKIFDVKPYITGKWYEELLDVEYFKTAHLENDGYDIEWEHGQSIDPEDMYTESSLISK